MTTIIITKTKTTKTTTTHNNKTGVQDLSSPIAGVIAAAAEHTAVGVGPVGANIGVRGGGVGMRGGAVSGSSRW